MTSALQPAPSPRPSVPPSIVLVTGPVGRCHHRRSEIHEDLLTPFNSYSFGLFAREKNLNPILFNIFQPLFPKHPGCGTACRNGQRPFADPFSGHKSTLTLFDATDPSHFSRKSFICNRSGKPWGRGWVIPRRITTPRATPGANSEVAAQHAVQGSEALSPNNVYTVQPKSPLGRSCVWGT
jgi:hypothetical protein